MLSLIMSIHPNNEEVTLMAKYKIIYHWTNGSESEDDNYEEYYSSESDAEEAALYGLSCAREGGKILEMSNPGDYPYDESDYENDSFEIIEVD